MLFATHGGADDGAALRVLDHAVDRSTLLLRHDGQGREERHGHEGRESSEAHPILLGSYREHPRPAAARRPGTVSPLV